MKILATGALWLGLAGVTCVTLVAQDSAKSSKPKAAKPSGQEMSMPMPTPAPEMTKLIKMMSGNWTVSEKSTPNPMMPQGGTGKGTAKLWAGPGGMSLLENYRSSGVMGNNFTGFGTFWWDAKENVYRGLWCDTMTPGGCDSSGTTKWEGDKLVGMMQSEMDGKKMVTRFIYSDWKPNSFVMSMEMGPDANSLKPAMTITYSKTATSAMAEKTMDEMKH